jgi:uncharacterized membrane protein YeiH
MLPLLQYLAVISAACFGVLLARSKGMDLIGVCSIAFTVAFGGGTLRDVLLDRSPLFWIAEEHYAWTVLGLAVVGSLLPRLPAALSNWLYLPDALGLGLYSVVGAGLALQEGTSLLIASLFGVITGTFGGVIGDIVVNEVPNLFRPAIPLYATCSFAGCWVFLGLLRLGVGDAPAEWIAVVVIVLFRMLALRFGWTLPKPRT